MLSFLKNHPFAVSAFFESSLVLTYAIPKEAIKHLIPECLTLDTLNDKWAFIAIAIVSTKHLRPRGFPEWTGNDFILTGYRVFVRYITSQGKHLRGLYILGSETNKKKMQVLGNIFTHYNYTTTDISLSDENTSIRVQSKQSELNIVVDVQEEGIELPQESPFKDWKEARRFAGPLPFTFTYDAENRKVLIIEGVRTNWKPKPVNVITCNAGFINQFGFNEIYLANAFLIRNVPYYWKKGKMDIWKG
jgi:uncharacterized protein YqjF (DUF2071 family)